MKSIIPLVCVVTFMGCHTREADLYDPIRFDVEVITDPPGAAVSVDGHYVGDSPVSVPVEFLRYWNQWESVYRFRGPVRKVLKATPKSGGGMYEHHVLVNPNGPKRVFFNLRLPESRDAQQDIQTKRVPTEVDEGEN